MQPKPPDMADFGDSRRAPGQDVVAEHERIAAAEDHLVEGGIGPEMGENLG